MCSNRRGKNAENGGEITKDGWTAVHASSRTLSLTSTYASHCGRGAARVLQRAAFRASADGGGSRVAPSQHHECQWATCADLSGSALVEYLSGSALVESC
eukprot:5289599-Prymnesium_polylepis.1